VDTAKEKDALGNDASGRTLAEIVLQTINSIVLVANGKGEILYASPSMRTILGYDSQELLGMRYWEIASPDPEARRKHLKNIAAVARGEQPAPEAPYAVKMLTKQGEERWILWRDAKGSDDLVVGAGQDITELRRTQEELRRREEEIGAVFERANDGMLVVDRDFRYVDANPAACELFGLSKTEIVGKLVGSIASIEAGMESLRERMELSGEATEELEYQNPNGRKRRLEYRITANIRPGFHLVIVRDITVRKLMERQTSESQRLEAVGRLAGGVAHEFNNMLTAITGYAELIVKGTAPEDSVHRYGQGIVMAASRAAQTTQQLLAFSRRQVVQPKMISVNEAIRDAAALLQSSVGEDIQIILRLNENCGSVCLDPGQLSQMLINLGMNARESMVRGGKLIIETNQARLDHSYVTKHVQVKPGPYVLISVSDTGIGIEPELQAHIFEPFFTTKDEGEGTGLGLATVYGIVRQNEGHIWVYSEPGAGTTFKVYLPAAGEKEIPADGSVKVVPATILVIEDDEPTRQLIANSLREQGYSVLQATDGGEALALCERLQGDLDLVITDLGAPAMSGEDLRAYFAMKQSKARLLHMSGYSEAKLKTTSELPPEGDFLQKPFTISELIQKVSMVLANQ